MYTYKDGKKAVYETYDDEGHLSTKTTYKTKMGKDVNLFEMYDENGQLTSETCFEKIIQEINMSYCEN